LCVSRHVCVHDHLLVNPCLLSFRNHPKGGRRRPLCFLNSGVHKGWHVTGPLPLLYPGLETLKLTAFMALNELVIMITQHGWKQRGSTTFHESRTKRIKEQRTLQPFRRWHVLDTDQVREMVRLNFDKFTQTLPMWNVVKISTTFLEFLGGTAKESSVYSLKMHRTWGRRILGVNCVSFLSTSVWNNFCSR
jgi:hypothetical protein